MPLPLEGLRVVALEQAVAAPFCSRYLADSGATVVKVERPDGGDFARHYDTVVHGQSAYFVWLNRGKQSLTLDLKQADGRAVLARLLQQADVFVHNLGPGAVERLGFGYEAVARDNARLVYCALSGYGSEGPYRERKAYDLLLQGETGIMAMTGTEEAPAKVGISICDIGAGLYAYSAILLALYDRERSGRGRRIEVTLFDAMTEWMSVPLHYWQYGGTALPRTGMRHNILVPYGPYRAAQGYVNLAVQNDGQWRRLCGDVLGRPELATDPRFTTNELRVRNRADLEPLIEEELCRLAPEELSRRLEAADVPYGSMNDVAAVAEHPQLAARDRWVEVGSPGGPFRGLASPLGLADFPPRTDPVPALGEHTDVILSALGYGPDEIGRLRAAKVV